jgi:hypothetical protein
VKEDEMAGACGMRRHMTNVSNILAVKPEGRHMCKCEDNTKMELKET